MNKETGDANGSAHSNSSANVAISSNNSHSSNNSQNYARSQLHPPPPNSPKSGSSDGIHINRRISNTSDLAERKKLSSFQLSESNLSKERKKLVSTSYANEENFMATKKSGIASHGQYEANITSKATVGENNTLKTSSISSSSTGSRRRQKERERQRGRPEGDMDVLKGERISPIMEVGGGGFVQELKSTNSSQPRSKHLDHSIKKKKAHDPHHGSNDLDWPSVPPDRVMDTVLLRPPPTPQFSPQPHVEKYVSPQNQLSQQLPPQQVQPVPAYHAVLHACDEKTGRCLFHPHITLRKKAILGVMGGWKDVLRACPECEAEDMMRLTSTTSSASGVSVAPPVPTELSSPSGNESWPINSANATVHPSSRGRQEQPPRQGRNLNQPRSRTLSPIDQSRKRLVKFNMGDKTKAMPGGGGIAAARRHQGKQILTKGNEVQENNSSSGSSGDSGSDSDDDDDSEGSSSSSSSSSSSKEENELLVQPQTERGRSGSFRKNNNGSSDSNLTSSAHKSNPSASGAGTKTKKSSRTSSNAILVGSKESQEDKPSDFISSYISSGVPSRPNSQDQSQLRSFAQRPQSQQL